MTIAQELSRATMKVVVYPLRANGAIAGSSMIGELNTSTQDWQIRLSGGQQFESTSLLIGVTESLDSVVYFGAEVTVQNGPEESLAIRVARGGIGERVLAEENRMPFYDAQLCKYRRTFSNEVYESWQQAGILQPMVLDKVLVCPNCSALPTFRFACSRCHSGRTSRAVLVHHFACAWVAPLSKFANDTSLKCPKCQTPHLIAGTDFEYAPGEHTCLDCGWKSHETVQVCHCLKCESRFPLHQAIEQEIEGFNVDRLDAMDLVPFTG